MYVKCHLHQSSVVLKSRFTVTMRLDRRSSMFTTSVPRVRALHLLMFSLWLNTWRPPVGTSFGKRFRVLTQLTLLSGGISACWVVMKRPSTFPHLTRAQSV